jgi:hypothetical protein
VVSGENNFPTDVELQSTQELDQNVKLSDIPNGTEDDEIVTLKVRTETGLRSIEVKLLASDPISKVYRMVAPHAESRDIRKFNLRTSFPYKEFCRESTDTLQECGLVPSAALVMH